MSAVVTHLLEQALLLPDDSRTELVEAILERSKPSEAFMTAQLKTVAIRMEKVRNGDSSLILADDAHQNVLTSLRLRE